MDNYKILAVDDDPIIRDLLEYMLKSGGYQVMLAANGNEAIKVLHDESFDVVITDLQMGEPDGFAVLREAKNLNPLTMGIVITGNQDVSSAIKAIKIGVDDYFLKPFSVSELLDCVRESIEKLELNRKITPEDTNTPASEEQNSGKISMMAHDIRSAVILMSTSVKFLKKGMFGKFPESVACELDKLSSRCANLMTLAEEYLDNLLVIKDDTGYFEGQKLDLLSEIVIPVLKEISVDIEENNTLIDNSIESSVGEIAIHGDRVLLKAVLRNIFHNAIRYGGNGCTIGFNLEELSNNYYQFSVFNNGPAISNGLQDKLFTQSDKQIGIDNNTKGTGIGLCFTKDIIEKHGGDMWYEEIDTYPHFLFTLPKRTTMNSGVSMLRG